MQTKYFKLVKPNYSSFHSDSFVWPVRGTVEVKDAVLDTGPCGRGLHLAKSINSGLKYAKFPFRLLAVKPLSPIIGEDDDKIRVSKAQSLGKLPLPQWAIRTECKIEKIKKEYRSIPWLKGKNEKEAKRLLRSHLKLLAPFGFKMDFGVKVIKDLVAARDASRDAARNYIWDTFRDAAWGVNYCAARDADRDTIWCAIRGAVWDAVRHTAWDVIRGAAWDAVPRYTAWDVIRDAARVAARDTVRFAIRGAARSVSSDAVWDAARDAAWESVADLMKQKNPFEPLLEIWKLGYWPIGFIGKKFVLFSESHGRNSHGDN